MTKLIQMEVTMEAKCRGHDEDDGLVHLEDLDFLAVDGEYQAPGWR